MESTTLKDNIKKPHKRNDGFASKCIRGLRDIKQIELAEAIGVSEKTMYKLEKMEVINEPYLSQIANALNVDVETITNFSTDCTIQINNNFNDESQLSQLNAQPNEAVLNNKNGVTFEEYKELTNNYINSIKEVEQLKRQILELQNKQQTPQ